MIQKEEISRSPADYFNAAIEAFERGELADSVTFLRGGFFENIYIAPLLLDQPVHAQSIWHSGPHAEPMAAREYVSRYRSLWEESPRCVVLLRLVWNDPLVRNELKSYVNLCKSLRNARGSSQREDLLRERQRFFNPERIVRTQSEILRRVSESELDVPVQRPHLGLVMLSSLDPAASIEFYRTLFGLEPVRVRNVAGGYAEFDLEGVRVAIHGYNQHCHGDPYNLGPPPQSLGWGAFFVIRVVDLDRYYENASHAEIDIIDSDLESRGSRFFVVKDPSGYVFEITDEELRGITE